MSRRLLLMISILALCAALGFAARTSDEGEKHASGLAGAPASAGARANPFEGKPEAVRAGRKLFDRYCAECHGADLGGRGKAPALDSGRVEQTPPGDLYWFLTNGNLRAGMPSWSRLPEAQRWQIVTYLKSLRKTQVQ
jgi:mono/diheme cytochrome c family protein